MKPFIETCREYEAAAGIYGPGLAASGRAPVDDFGATANAEKQLRIELAGRLIAKYWTERHAVLEADVRSLMRGAEEGNLEGMAEALVDYLDCDGEISAVSADAIAALGASASAYMKSYAGLEKSAWLTRIESARVLLGMKVVLDLRRTIRTMIPRDRAQLDLPEYERLLGRIGTYGSPYQHVLSGLEGYFLVLRALLELKLEEPPADAGAVASIPTDWCVEKVYRLMAGCSRMHMQSFVALEEMLSGDRAKLLKFASDGERREPILALDDTAEAPFHGVHEQCKDRSNTRARVRIGCPAFQGPARLVAMGIHAHLAMPLILGAAHGQRDRYAQPGSLTHRRPGQA